MNTDNYFLKQLPKEFTRQEVLKLVVQNGYSISKANSFLEHVVFLGKAKRIKRGIYSKVDDVFLIVKDLHKQGYSYREIAEKVGISKSQVGNYIKNNVLKPPNS